MSGGHFSYSHLHIPGVIEEIQNDPEVMARWPRLASNLAEEGNT